MHDEIPIDIEDKVWKRADARCECENPKHGHGYLCDEPLYHRSRGSSRSDGWWIYIEGEWNIPTPEICTLMCHYCYQLEINPKHPEFKTYRGILKNRRKHRSYES